MNGQRPQGYDEILEAIWTCEEVGKSTVPCILEAAHGGLGAEGLRQVVEAGLASIEGELVRLTGPGRAQATIVIRSHRLAERLFVDVLGLGLEETERLACTFEHAVLPEVIEGICTLLGHPSECPHGKAIPPGNCCLERRQQAGQALTPLSEAPIGRRLRVAYLRTRDHERLHLLLSLGLGPGVMIRLHQRTPVLVVQVDQGEFALDRDVAQDVFAWLEPETQG